jgi:hypothetical protein
MGKTFPSALHTWVLQRTLCSFPTWASSSSSPTFAKRAINHFSNEIFNRNKLLLARLKKIELYSPKLSQRLKWVERGSKKGSERVVERGRPQGRGSGRGSGRQRLKTLSSPPFKHTPFNHPPFKHTPFKHLGGADRALGPRRSTRC